jgi:stage II sporulation protein D
MPLWLLVLLLLAPALVHGAETVRIGMGERPGPVTLKGRNLAAGPDAEDGPFTPLGAGEARLRVQRGRLEVNGILAEASAVRFRAGETEHGTGDEPIRAGSTGVRGDVVALVRKGRLLLVNVLPLEDYVVAVLGGEMPPSFPLEALRAQAVAARTYALNKKLETLDEPFHLGSSVLAQVYGGLERENPKTRDATDSTRGQVLTFDLEPIEAYFHSSCGGQTETGLSALGRDLPYLRSVSCPCGKHPATQWSTTLSAQELEDVLGHEARGEMKVLGRTSTGRVRHLQVGGRSLDGVEFRQRFGYERVRSLLFDVTPDGKGGVRLVGRGFGHGAGLCQWGAKLMADAGKSYREILVHYYPGTELQTLY